MSVDPGRLKDRFKERFGRNPVWGARAPGRVNLIGEHIDYNGGKVAPAAIDREIAMLAAPAGEPRFQLYSATFEEGFSWEVNTPPTGAVSSGWPNYFLGVMDELRSRGFDLEPMNVAMDGDIPIGGGLSSSAAFEVCAAHLCLASLGATLPGEEIALLSQAAENGPRVGMRCGIMDQYVSACGVEGHALLLDCRRLEAEPFPLDSDRVSLVIAHSTVARELVGSGYNQRREQCEEGLRLLNERLGRDEKVLLGYSLEEVGESLRNLPDVVQKRLRHVFSEQNRAHDFKKSLTAGDFEKAGELMNASHASLRDDYQVTCAKLDRLVEIANELDGVFGCRMTGAGFGGCVVALARRDRAKNIAEALALRFEKRVGSRPWTLVTKAEGGAESFDPR